MSGEKPELRKAMEKMAKQMTEAGSRPDYAIKKAREAAIRRDRRENERR